MSSEETHQLGITVSFTTDEISWLAWVVRDILQTHHCVPPGESACDKILKAEQLLTYVDKVTNG